MLSAFGLIFLRMQKEISVSVNLLSWGCGEKRSVTAGNSASTYLQPSPNPARPLSCKRHHPGRGVEGMCKLNHLRVRAPLPLPSNVVFLMFVFD